ncbi:MAG: hypothetical protein ACKVS9_13150 [Phycisphaerae bacterium]
MAGEKELTDDTLIAGPNSVQYTVQGQRAGSSGPLSPTFTVNFGQAPGAGFSATVLGGQVGCRLARLLFVEWSSGHRLRFARPGAAVIADAPA